ncbi:MAG: hypothetical protein IJ187_05480 [Neisseriaceae bacterium]|nr:hypothetical protein [Neisseriaceae bacterium]
MINYFYRGVDEKIDFDEMYNVKILRFHSLNDLKIDVNEAARYIIKDNRFTLPIDFLYYPSKNENLYIGLHGREARRESLPVFQFVRSFNFTYKNTLFFADTTILLHEKLTLGWYLGDQNTPLPQIIADIITQVMKESGAILPIIVGHSGGGYAAVRIGANIDNSIAISVNGQSIPSLYEPTQFDILHQYGFPTYDTNKFLQYTDLTMICRDHNKKGRFFWFGSVDDDLFGETGQFTLLAKSLLLDDKVSSITPMGDELIVYDVFPKPPNAHALPGTVLPFIKLVVPNTTQLVGEPAKILLKKIHSKQQDELLLEKIIDIYDNKEISIKEQIENQLLKKLQGDYVCVQINFHIENNIFYLRLEGSLSAQQCVVLYNGAVLLDKKNNGIFQRSTWVKELEAFVINVDDPTVRLHKDMALGWGQGTLNNYFSIKMAQNVQLLLEVLNLTTTQRVHFGSSAGGYQAIVGGSLDTGSRVVVVNPQIDWTHHFVQSHINRLLQVSFSHFTVEALQANYPERVNCLKFVKMQKYIPCIDYYVNASFPHDIKNQCSLFIDFIAENAHLFEQQKFRLFVYNDKKAGHNPPDKNTTIKYIKNAFEAFNQQA